MKGNKKFFFSNSKNEVGYLRQNKVNAFTLIELLAIIVILAIIAVITVPIILNIIENTKIGSTQNSVYGIVDSARLDYAKKQLNNKKMLIDSNILSDLEYEGTTFDEYQYYGYGVYVNELGQVAAALERDNKCYIKEFNSTEVEIKDFVIGDCAIASSTIRWDGTTEEIIPDGDIYYISNPKQLAWISEQVNAGTNNFEGKQVILINDLNMGALFDKEGNLLDDDSHAFTTIKNFAGNFNGNNHKIYNLYINIEGSTAGLFGGYLGTEFKNLTVENSYINANGYLAGIIGGNSSSSPILNIENIKSINNIIKSNGYIGGIAAQLSNGNITNCYSNSSITGMGIAVGGIVGRFTGTNIENNINDGNVISNSYNVGGIVGNAIDSTNIKNNINNGNIISSSYSVGGIVGLEIGVTNINNNINNGTVQGETKTIGGIAGKHNSNTQLSTYLDNINNGEVKTSKGAYSIGGIVGDISPGIVLLNNINNGNIDGVGDGTYGSIYGAGGIAGTIGNSTANSYMYNNYNRGNVKSKQNAGGIVGNTYSNTLAGVVVKNSINEGTVEATNGYAGGIIGVHDTNTSTEYISNFITNAYNKGTVKGTNASGLVGRNIGIKNSITVGSLEGTNNYGVIANAPSGVNIENVYYPNTQTSSYGTGIDITTLNDTALRNIIGDGFSYNNGSVSLYKAYLTIENNEVTNCTYSNEILY